MTKRRQINTQLSPATATKLAVLAERVAGGLPLWHPEDRDDIEKPARARKKPR